jgi:hypothetical protein
LGLRHCGQRASVGADVRHWARRDLVLLRDVLRFGTATSALLSIRGGHAALTFCSQVQLAQPRPPRIERAVMVMLRASIRQAHSALYAQTRAIWAA